jgi:hypothetical protein
MKAYNHALKFGTNEGEVGPVFNKHHAVKAHSSQQHMKVSGQLQAPLALPLRNSPRPQLNGRAPGQDWTVCKDKISCPCRE